MQLKLDFNQLFSKALDMCLLSGQDLRSTLVIVKFNLISISEQKYDCLIDTSGIEVNQPGLLISGKKIVILSNMFSVKTSESESKSLPTLNFQLNQT